MPDMKMPDKKPDQMPDMNMDDKKPDLSDMPGMTHDHDKMPAITDINAPIRAHIS